MIIEKWFYRFKKIRRPIQISCIWKVILDENTVSERKNSNIFLYIKLNHYVIFIDFFDIYFIKGALLCRCVFWFKYSFQTVLSLQCKYKCQSLNLNSFVKTWEKHYKKINKFRKNCFKKREVRKWSQWKVGQKKVLKYRIHTIFV